MYPRETTSASVCVTVCWRDSEVGLADFLAPEEAADSFGGVQLEVDISGSKWSFLFLKGSPYAPVPALLAVSASKAPRPRSVRPYF